MKKYNKLVLITSAFLILVSINLTNRATTNIVPTNTTTKVPESEMGELPEIFATKQECRSMKTDLNSVKAKIKSLKDLLFKNPMDKKLLLEIIKLQSEETVLEANFATNCEKFEKKK